MSASFLSAAETRATDRPVPQLSTHYAIIAEALPQVVRSLLVHNVDPSTVDTDALLVALGELGTESDWASRSSGGVRTVPGVLDLAQCAALRATVDASTMELTDTVDGQLEYQLALSVSQLEDLIGAEAVAACAALAAQGHAQSHAMVAGANMSPAATAAACAAGVNCTSHCLASQPHYIFARRYSAATRPWIHFHHDCASLTLNIALTDDEEHTGGRLLAVDQGAVQWCRRSEGSATVHASTLLHAVTRMTHGARYALILFYGRVCPDAAHALVRCDAPTMALLYPPEGGSYSCNTCGDSAEMLGFPGMWHCADGCEYDVCDVCYDYVL
eukprot:4556403-Prymnesium_polylepis.1